MATAAGIREAARIFAERLETTPVVAAQLTQIVLEAYANQIALHRDHEVVETAVWAADRLRARYGRDLFAVTPADVTRALRGGGCPLCASSGNSPRGRGRGSGTPGGNMPTPSGAAS